jgi:hypothetical protein
VPVQHDRGPEYLGVKVEHTVQPNDDEGVKVTHKLGGEKGEKRTASQAVAWDTTMALHRDHGDVVDVFNHPRPPFTAAEALLPPSNDTTGPASSSSADDEPEPDPAAAAAPRHGRFSRSRKPHAPAPAPASAASYAQAMLDQHNRLRAHHAAPALAWSAPLADVARQVGETCVYAYHHTDADGGLGVGGRYGQTIGAGAPPRQAPALVADDMYAREIDFFPRPFGQDQPDRAGFAHWRRFAQLVWAASAHVGCATVDCSSANTTAGLAEELAAVPGWFTVCTYSPAGNVAGRYAANVAPAQGA